MVIRQRSKTRLESTHKVGVSACDAKLSVCAYMHTYARVPYCEIQETVCPKTLS